MNEERYMVLHVHKHLTDSINVAAVLNEFMSVNVAAVLNKFMSVNEDRHRVWGIFTEWFYYVIVLSYLFILRYCVLC